MSAKDAGSGEGEEGKQPEPRTSEVEEREVTHGQKRERDVDGGGDDVTTTRAAIYRIRVELARISFGKSAMWREFRLHIALIKFH